MKDPKKTKDKDEVSPDTEEHIRASIEKNRKLLEELAKY